MTLSAAGAAPSAADTGQRTAVVVGLAALPPAPAERRPIADALLALDEVGGLDLNVLDPTWNADAGWLAPMLIARGRHAFSLVGAFMHARATGVGLAATDDVQRRGGVALVRRAWELVHDLQARGDGRVAHVLIQSAPHARDLAGARDAFARSLDDVLAWDWGSTVLLVEHCDSARPDGSHAKGFLPVDAEIDILRARAGAPTGLVVNWGRSVLEHRDPAAAVRHVAAARSAGVLEGITLSGVGAADTPLGPAWADTHASFADTAAGAEPASILTLERAREFIAAAGDDASYRAVRMAFPELTPAADRLRVIAEAARLLDAK